MRGVRSILSPSRRRDVDQAWVERGEDGIIQAEGTHRTGAQVFDEDAGAPDELAKSSLPDSLTARLRLLRLGTCVRLTRRRFGRADSAAASRVRAAPRRSREWRLCTTTRTSSDESETYVRRRDAASNRRSFPPSPGAGDVSTFVKHVKPDPMLSHLAEIRPRAGIVHNGVIPSIRDAGELSNLALITNERYQRFIHVVDRLVQIRKFDSEG